MAGARLVASRDPRVRSCPRGFVALILRDIMTLRFHPILRISHNGTGYTWHVDSIGIATVLFGVTTTAYLDLCPLLALGPLSNNLIRSELTLRMDSLWQ